MTMKPRNVVYCVQITTKAVTESAPTTKKCIRKVYQCKSEEKEKKCQQDEGQSDQASVTCRSDPHRSSIVVSEPPPYSGIPRDLQAFPYSMGTTWVPPDASAPLSPSSHHDEYWQPNAIEVGSNTLMAHRYSHTNKET